jgi:hypothetical protein
MGETTIRQPQVHLPSTYKSSPAHCGSNLTARKWLRLKRFELRLVQLGSPAGVVEVAGKVAADAKRS